MTISSYGGSLRACGDCSAFLLVIDTATPTVYCSKCQAKQPSGDAWAASLKRGERVYLYPYAAWQGLSHSEYLVLGRDGDDLEVQLLGIPSSRMTVHLSACSPRDMTPRRGDAL
jgi:hypothetical protein